MNMAHTPYRDNPNLGAGQNRVLRQAHEKREVERLTRAAAPGGNTNSRPQSKPIHPIAKIAGAAAVGATIKKLQSESNKQQNSPVSRNIRSDNDSARPVKNISKPATAPKYNGKPATDLKTASLDYLEARRRRYG
jgi:hypothetical protein